MAEENYENIRGVMLHNTGINGGPGHRSVNGLFGDENSRAISYSEMTLRNWISQMKLSGEPVTAEKLYRTIGKIVLGLMPEKTEEEVIEPLFHGCANIENVCGLGEPAYYEPIWTGSTNPKYYRYTKEDFERTLCKLRDGPDAEDISELTELNEYLEELAGKSDDNDKEVEK